MIDLIDSNIREDEVQCKSVRTCRLGESVRAMQINLVKKNADSIFKRCPSLFLINL
jgi:hypothetical protein